MTDVRHAWPNEPPEPTDRHQSTTTADLPARKCIYCDTVIDQRVDDETFPYLTHLDACDKSATAIHISTDNQFNIVVPEQSGYVWSHQVGGFACRQVTIQGTLIPLGRVTELNLGPDYPSPDVDVDQFAAFDDPEQARDTYVRGLRQSLDHEYGGIDLGAKLIAETLDGVYTDDQDERDRKFETRHDRILAVWERIDETLPFTYNRVVAPFGRPVTQEGLRWIDITGHQHDKPLLQEDWVDALIERDAPVALYYPNSD